jgi:hypothetical protein
VSPELAIIWIAVAIFAIAAVITLLAFAGILKNTDPDLTKKLYAVLIVQVVAICLSVASQYFTHPKSSKLPVTEATVIEQGPAIELIDEDTSIYVRAADVGRSRRVASIEIAADRYFNNSKKIEVAAEKPASVSLGKKTYEIGFKKMGTIDANPDERMSKSSDFVLLNVAVKK